MSNFASTLDKAITVSISPIYIDTYHRKFFQHCLVFLRALHEAPVTLVEMCVELLQHGHLLGNRNVHVVLDCVQSTQHQVKYTDGWSRPHIHINKTLLMCCYRSGGQRLCTIPCQAVHISIY